MNIKYYLKTVRNKFIPPKDYVIFDNSILPAKNLRFNGPLFSDDRYYLETAEKEAKRVVEKLGCNLKTNILEIGCGSGRFAVGLLRVVGPLNYVGMDVHKPSIIWCKKHIEKNHPTYRFEYLDVVSERYNTEGLQIKNDFKFNIPDKSLDIIYIWGVLTNMEEKVMRIYFNDLKRMLKPNGKVFLTAFVEENVPNCEVNPAGYLFEEFSGPLHVVRYEKNYLTSIIKNAGFHIDEFNYGIEFDGQSEFYLSINHAK